MQHLFVLVCLRSFPIRKSRLINGPVRCAQIDFEGSRNDITVTQLEMTTKATAARLMRKPQRRVTSSASIFRVHSARRWFLARQKRRQEANLVERTRSPLAPVIGLPMRSAAEIFAGNNRVESVGNYRLLIGKFCQRCKESRNPITAKDAIYAPLWRVHGRFDHANCKIKSPCRMW